MPYTPPQIDTDPDAVIVEVLDAMADRMPGWVADESAPEVVLAEEIGRELAATNQLAVDSVTAAFAAFGETVFGVPAIPAASATIPVTVTVTAAGDTLPAGFTVLGVGADGRDVAFNLPAAVTASSTSVTVTLVAATPGTAGNGVPAGPLTIATATATALSATATAESTGGVDEEPILTYLDRLVAYTSSLRPGGVRAADVAALARTVPGVDRALALDLYDPATPATPAERTVTVVPITATNTPVAAGISDQVLALLGQYREVNFRFFAAAPTYTNLTIAYTAVAETGASPTAVQAAIAAAVTKWLLAWGTTPGDPDAWVNTPTVRFLDLARVVGSADGVAYIASLTLNGGTSDVTLSGAAPLPAPIGAGSGVSGTVS
ncbi:baseplate J/gp47 family protein [Nocardioides sp. TRM66260-LWL]|uniref:baseplate J/gp47 family protein n=1 Tax=Nocardioides sp. TRM66260-LWL TaxID=2874478 RepID=UPI001CC4C34C|nr:baseplate J/gp47 family protein [Nocardioides sp. TRM66260-LWL]MBZ5736504.1 baseplate J/gp47 family protein [Nocardioides sp. TRM66260-LWL]